MKIFYPQQAVNFITVNVDVYQHHQTTAPRNNYVVSNIWQGTQSVENLTEIWSVEFGETHESSCFMKYHCWLRKLPFALRQSRSDLLVQYLHSSSPERGNKLSGTVPRRWSRTYLFCSTDSLFSKTRRWMTSTAPHNNVRIVLCSPPPLIKTVVTMLQIIIMFHFVLLL